MKNLICFSLWGNKDLYNYGALENALIAKYLFPDWTCCYYYSETCNKKIITALSKLNNVKLIKMSGQDDYSNSMWRFIPAFNEPNIIYISRDTDSRLNIKEKLAIEEWLNSDKDFHIMRDSISHNKPIMAGMWGCRNNILLPYKNRFDSFQKHGYYGIDQDFLEKEIYPLVVNKSTIHASRHKFEPFAKNFPTSDYNDFVGSYCYTAPLSFLLLNEKPRLLTR